MYRPYPTTEEKVGSTSIKWRADGFSHQEENSPHYDFFKFNRIILPIRVCHDRLEIRVEPAARIEILRGAPAHELERFRRRISAEVIAVVRPSPFGCSDCAAEAGLSPAMWDGTVCPSCREDYCRNARCLRRLKIVILRDGTPACRECGTENSQAGIRIAAVLSAP